jgi:hypothetical protein
MILPNSFLAKANEQLYKEIGFLEVVQIFQIYLAKFKGNAKLRQENPIDTRRFYRKKCFTLRVFSICEQESTNQSNLALSDNEKRDYCKHLQNTKQ